MTNYRNMIILELAKGNNQVKVNKSFCEEKYY